MNSSRRRWSGSLLWLALPLWVQAQTQALPRIAWVWPGTRDGEQVRAAAFREGMAEAGLVQGKDYVLDERYADGHYERFATLVSQLLARAPAVLMANTIASIRAAQEATKTVPIVFVSTNDPLGSGLIASYARPGGNTTGLSSQNEDTVVKLVQLMHELLPRARRLAVLVNPGNVSGPKLFEILRVAARGLDIEASAVEVSSPEGLDTAFDTVVRRRADVLMTIPDAMFVSERQRIAALALALALPYITTSREAAAAGAVLTYGQLQLEQFRRAAIYVKQILAGARPGEMPVEQPLRFSLVINLKTAKVLRLTVPQALLLRADEVIQ